MGEFKNKYNDYYNILQTKLPPFPKVMLLETTNYCNHNCIFCSHAKMTRPSGFMKKELAFRIMEEAYREGVEEIGFYMFGEPLLDKHLDEYVRYAKKLGFTYTFITTNGYLLDEEKMFSLIEAGLDSIKFSFNAGTRDHYLFAHGVDGFQRVKDNITTLSEYRTQRNKNFKIYISSVLTRYTKDDGEEIRKIFGSVVDDILILECQVVSSNL